MNWVVICLVMVVEIV